MAAITVAQLTSATLDGAGIFDTLMRANKAHLESEFSKGRIKGPEYATVYLGSLTQILQTGLEFLVQQQRVDLEAQLMAEQILLAKQQVLKAAAEVAAVEAQTALAVQQKANLVAEALNIPKQGTLIDAQTTQTNQQTTNLAAEKLRIDAQKALVDEQIQSENKQNELDGILDKQKLQVVAQTTLLTQQAANLTAEKLNIERKTTNLAAEALNIPKQGAVLDAQALQIGAEKDRSVAQKLLIDKQAALVAEQIESEAFRNFVHPTDDTLSGILEKEREVLIAQECKLRAEFDLLKENTLKAAQEKGLLAQKVLTEKAQTVALGVEADSVIGRQKLLYQAQTAGFTRDAEQKAAKLMIDTWNVRRTTDEATAANLDNKLTDADVGRAVNKLLTGIGA